MDLSVASVAPGATVACPVCTLYLREGISLQKHLDTHPKEQVIEALIKASSGGTPSQPQPQPQPQQQQQQPAPAQATASPPVPPSPVPSPHMPPQTPYPVGLFECPPINTMMPPQFASFSYQQFVNNGTMMIPQYAMAPQNQQMMQMFYHPYGMYHQQQIPTVQMISPVSPMSGTTTTTMTAMTARFKTPGMAGVETLPQRNASVDKDLPQEVPETVIPDMEPPLEPRMEVISLEEDIAPPPEVAEERGAEVSDQEVEEGESVLPHILHSEIERFIQSSNQDETQSKDEDETAVASKDDFLEKSREEPQVEEVEALPATNVQNVEGTEAIAEEPSKSPKDEARMELEENERNAAEKLYVYRHSQSMPTSPVATKKFHRTFSRASLYSDFGSSDNLCMYSINFDANALQEMDNNDDESNNEPESTDFHNHYMDVDHVEATDMERERSQTPLSNISDISGLKITKPCSPSSFSNLDTDSGTQDGEDYAEGVLVENDMPIDCSRTQTEERSGENLKFEEEEDAKMKGVASAEAEVSFPNSAECTSGAISHVEDPLSVELDHSQNLLNLAESIEPSTSSSSSKSFQMIKTQPQKPMTELLNISEDAHVGPVNVFEFDGLQILVPSTFISDSSQKAVSGTSQQSMASSEGGAGMDEEIKSVNMRTDESMPPRGELSEQESNGCTEQSAWQVRLFCSSALGLWK